MNEKELSDTKSLETNNFHDHSLHQAATAYDYPKVKALIEKHVNPLIPNDQGKLPIELAKQYVFEQIQNGTQGYKEAFSNYLNQKKVSADISSEIDHTNPLALMMLLENYTEKRKVINMYFEAAKTGNLKKLEEIYNSHIKDGQWLNIDITDEKNYSALEYSARNGHYSCFNWLKNKGANSLIKVRTNKRPTALVFPLKNYQLETDKMYQFAEQGDKKAIVKLFNRGVNHTIGQNGMAPIHIAVQKGHLDCIEYFLLKSVFIDMPDAKGLTPLHHAIKHSKKNSFNVLIDRGANLNIQAHNGNTALHWAVENDVVYYLQILLNKKIDLFICNENKLTPLDLATKTNKPDHEKLIKIHIRSSDPGSIVSSQQNIANIESPQNDTVQGSGNAKSQTPSVKKYRARLNKRTFKEIKAALESNDKETIRSLSQTKEQISKETPTSCDIDNTQFNETLQEVNANNYEIERKNLPASVLSVLELLTFTYASIDNPVKIFITGGAIRTFVYNFFYKKNKSPRDYDIIVDVPLAPLKNVISEEYTSAECEIKGTQEQSLRISLNNTKIDIAFLDKAYGKDILPTLQNNTLKRDAAMNAMYYDPYGEKLYYFPTAISDFKNKSLTTFKNITLLLDYEPSILFRLLRIANELDFTLVNSSEKRWPILVSDMLKSKNFYYPKFYKELFCFFNSSIDKYNGDKSAGLFSGITLLDKLKIDVSLIGIHDKILTRAPSSANINIFDAVTSNDVTKLQIALANQQEFNDMNAHQDTPLSLAIKLGHIECCCYLLMVGASINQAIELLNNKQQPESTFITSTI